MKLNPGHLVAIVAAAIAIAAGSGCSRCERTTDSETAASQIVVPYDDATDILLHPVSFDARSVDECARLVAVDRELTTAETARIIVTAEAALNRQGEILEELARNDDPADTFHAVRELDQMEWPRQLTAIIEGLDCRPLDMSERERLDAMIAAAGRNNALLAQLRAE